MTDRKNEFTSRLSSRIQWLYSEWGEGTPPPIDPEAIEQTKSSTETGTARKLLQPDGRIVIERNGRMYDLLGR
jgi:hypothetical protein